MIRWLFALCLLAAAAISSNRALAAPDDCARLFALPKVLSAMQRNSFTVHRDLAAYESDFGFLFRQRVGNLRRGQHWLDVGAGDGNAQLDYLRERSSDAARVTAIAYRRGWESRLYNSKLGRGENRFISGRMVEAISNQEIGQADLITDVFGALSYTNDPVLVLRKYLELLKPDGHLMFVGMMSKVKVGEKEILFTDWLAQQKGIEVKVLKETTVLDYTPMHPDPEKYHAVEVRVTDLAAALQLPKLKTLRTTDALPPQFIFQE